MLKNVKIFLDKLRQVNAADFFFTLDDLRRPDGAKWVCSPPMRTAEDNAALWRALSEGVILTMGTDHCPFFFDGTRPIEYEGQKVAIPGEGVVTGYGTVNGRQVCAFSQDFR
jgi:hypothetical protein